MSCVNCSNSIESYVGALDGILSASVNFTTAKGVVEFDASKISSDKIIEAIEELGFTAQIEKQKKDVSFHAGFLSDIIKRPQLLVAVIFALPVFTLNMFYCHLKYAAPAMAIGCLPVLLYSAAAFHKKTFICLKKRLPLTMDALISSSSISSYLLSLFLYLRTGSRELYFDSAASIIAIVLIGKAIEDKIRSSARNNISGIIEGLPDNVTLKKDGREIETPVREIKSGDIFIIKPNRRIAIDAVITSGSGLVESAAITGESIPRYLFCGDKIWAGGTNFDAALEARALSDGRQSYIDGIQKTLAASLDKKANIQKTADKISARFVPFVFLLSFITFIAHFAFYSSGAQQALISSISVIAIACPCALGLALPVAFLFGANTAAGMGILYTDPDALVKIGKIDTLVLDKTGTLTKNKLTVSAVHFLETDEIDKIEILQCLGALERYSEHPIAGAVIQYLKNAGIKYDHEISSYKTHDGRGLSAVCRGREIIAGNINLIGCVEKFNAIPKAKGANMSFYVSSGKRVAARIDIAEELSDGAAEMIARLRERNIDVYLLTGDSENGAMAAAALSGINEGNVMHSVKPYEKLDFIRKLKKDRPAAGIAMAGDGINDALAMAEADVAIAMAEAASIAKTAAAIILSGNDIKNIVNSLDLGRKIGGVIRQNFFWAFFYNVILIPYAMAGKLNPMQAAFAMMFSSLFVVLNSTRLKKI